MISPLNVEFIERLRTAAKEHGAVADLLESLRDGLLIDGNGNKEIMAEGVDLEIIENAIVAADFSAFDRAGE
jgi:hypothetical protein